MQPDRAFARPTIGSPPLQRSPDTLTPSAIVSKCQNSPLVRLLGYFFVTLHPQSKKLCLMDTIKIKDLTFQLSITEQQIQQRIQEIGRQIHRDFAGKNPIFLVVLNGAFMFASDLLKEVEIPCQVSFIRLSSYVGTQSTGEVKEIMGINTPLEQRHVIIVEDIVDTGVTMKNMWALLSDHKPASIHLASLLVKPKNLKVNVNIDYTGFNIGNDFIVGYGLDYDGYGRNERNIYVLKS